MTGYTIDWSSNNSEGIAGKEPIYLNQKTTDTSSTSLPLTGKGVSNYGEIQQENFLRLMENFASASAPAHPTVGQIWYNPADVALYICVEIDKTPGVDFYYAEAPIAWAKIFPGSGSNSGGGSGSVSDVASFAQYQTLALDFNRIIGTPVSYNPGATPLDNELLQWGWGQTDLVPVYSSLTSLAAGFSAATYPSTFSNESWIIFLSRLRKALRQVGISEAATSPVGFKNDGKPLSGSNATADLFNSYPSPGSLPNYTSGWGSLTSDQVAAHYAVMLDLLNQLKIARFKLSAGSVSPSSITVRNLPDARTASHTEEINVYFASETAAKAFFNAGGNFEFVWSHNPSVIDAFNLSWQNFLLATSNVIFDYAGVRRGTNYKKSTAASNASIGYYNLPVAGDPPIIVYEAVRNVGDYNVSGSVGPTSSETVVVPPGSVVYTGMVTVRYDGSVIVGPGPATFGVQPNDGTVHTDIVVENGVGVINGTINTRGDGKHIIAGYGGSEVVIVPPGSQVLSGTVTVRSDDSVIVGPGPAIFNAQPIPSSGIAYTDIVLKTGALVVNGLTGFRADGERIITGYVLGGGASGGGASVTVGPAAPVGPQIGSLWYDNGSSGRGYVWDGTTWADFAPGAAGGVTVSATAPVGPSVGNLWYDNDLMGRCFVWDGSAWLDIAPPLGSGGGGGASVTVSATAPSSPATGDLWYDNGTTGRTYIWDGSGWVDSSPAGSGGGTGGVGVGQTWQVVTGSRALGTTYTNSTGKPITVSVQLRTNGGGGGYFSMNINGVTILGGGIQAAGGDYLGGYQSVVVPDGHTYSVTITTQAGSPQLVQWAELR